MQATFARPSLGILFLICMKASDTMWYGLITSEIGVLSLVSLSSFQENKIFYLIFIDNFCKRWKEFEFLVKNIDLLLLENFSFWHF